MAKVFHVTLVLEIEDDTPDPDEWDWSGLAGTIPGLIRCGLATADEVPHSSEDPAIATLH